MRKRALCIACAVLIGVGGTLPCKAGFSDGSAECMVADTVLVRPLCLVATVVGSAFFLVSLPVAAISKSTDKTAQTLVTAPAKATFTRPLGKFSSLE